MQKKKNGDAVWNNKKNGETVWKKKKKLYCRSRNSNGPYR